MEYTQWEKGAKWSYNHLCVLILVVMEYTQWASLRDNRLSVRCLNPCCNGIYSMSCRWCYYGTKQDVLILVVMEYTQWDVTPSFYGERDVVS